MYSSQKRSVLVSGLLHAAAIVVVLALTHVPTRQVTRFLHEVLLMPPAEAVSSRLPGGGGGGKHSILPASQGRLPRQALRQFTPPQVVILNENPKLPMEPTILVAPDIALPQVNLAQYGIPNGVPGPLSDGTGSGGGIGNHGNGTGVGDGHGPGYGDGPGGPGFGSGRSGFQGAVTAPSVLTKVDPDYSDEARKAHLQGTVVLRIDVDPRGAAQNIRVAQSLGLGLDERAMEAVKHWRFRPGTVNGKPVSAPALIEVFFRLL